MSKHFGVGAGYEKLDDAEGQQSGEIYEMLDTLQEARNVITVLSTKLQKFEDDRKELSSKGCPNCKQLASSVAGSSGQKKSSLQNEITKLKQQAKIDRTNWESELIQMKRHVIKMKNEYEEMAQVLSRCRKELERLKSLVSGEKENTAGLANDCRHLVQNLQDALQKNMVLENAYRVLKEENTRLQRELES